MAFNVVSGVDWFRTYTLEAAAVDDDKVLVSLSLSSEPYLLIICRSFAVTESLLNDWSIGIESMSERSCFDT